MEEKLIAELEFCLGLWEKQGYCEFGGHTRCEQCAAPYLIYKLITGEAIHGKDVRRLSLDEWREKLDEIKKNY